MHLKCLNLTVPYPGHGADKPERRVEMRDRSSPPLPSIVCSCFGSPPVSAPHAGSIPNGPATEPHGHGGTIMPRRITEALARGLAMAAALGAGLPAWGQGTTAWASLGPNGVQGNGYSGIVKLTNLTLNSPSEEVCQRRRLSGKFLTKGFIM
jgi:hypothetical protein